MRLERKKIVDKEDERDADEVSEMENESWLGKHKQNTSGRRWRLTGRWEGGGTGGELFRSHIVLVG